MEWQDLIEYCRKFANNQKGFKTISRSDWNGKTPLLNYNIIPNDDNNVIYENNQLLHTAKIEFQIIEDSKETSNSLPIDRAMLKLKQLKMNLVNDEKIIIHRVYEQMAFDYSQGKMLDKTILTCECSINYEI